MLVDVLVKVGVEDGVLVAVAPVADGVEVIPPRLVAVSDGVVVVVAVALAVAVCVVATLVALLTVAVGWVGAPAMVTVGEAAIFDSGDGAGSLPGGTSVRGSGTRHSAVAST